MAYGSNNNYFLLECNSAQGLRTSIMIQLYSIRRLILRTASLTLLCLSIIIDSVGIAPLRLIMERLAARFVSSNTAVCLRTLWSKLQSINRGRGRPQLVRAESNAPGGFEMKTTHLYRVILDSYHTTSSKLILAAEYGAKSQKVARSVSVQARKNRDQNRRANTREKA